MFDVNLARKPFWNIRAFIFVIAVLAVVTLAVSILNGRTLYRVLTGSEETRSEIQHLEEAIADLEKKNRDLQTRISAVDVDELGDEITLLNQIISERTLSWSALLDKLEAILPRVVRITSLVPTPQEDGSISLALTCLTEERDGMLQLIDALIESPHFADPVPGTLRDQETGVPEGRRFTLSVRYLPEAAP